MRWESSPVLTTAFSASGTWEFLKINFYAACNLSFSPGLCTREEVLPLSFPRPSLLLYQRRPYCFHSLSIFSHFLLFLGSFKYQQASPKLKKNPSLNRDCLCISSFSLPILKKVCTSFFSLSTLCPRSSATLCICFDCHLFFSPGCVYILFLQLDCTFFEVRIMLQFFFCIPHNSWCGVCFTLSLGLYLQAKTQS